MKLLLILATMAVLSCPYIADAIVTWQIGAVPAMQTAGHGDAGVVFKMVSGGDR